MVEYIEREALKKKLGDLHFPNYGYALIAINEIPAADVVEVCRCRDCEYFYEVTEDDKSMGYGYCDIPNDEVRGDGRRVPNDYCSYGERKESK